MLVTLQVNNALHPVWATVDLLLKRLIAVTPGNVIWTVQQNTVRILILLYYLILSESKVTPKAYSAD